MRSILYGIQWWLQVDSIKSNTIIHATSSTSSVGDSQLELLTMQEQFEETFAEFPESHGCESTQVGWVAKL